MEGRKGAKKKKMYTSQNFGIREVKKEGCMFFSSKFVCYKRRRIEFPGSCLNAHSECHIAGMRGGDFFFCTIYLRNDVKN